MGAMLGGVVPAGGLVVAAAVPYTVPDVGHEDRNVQCATSSLRPITN